MNLRKALMIILMLFLSIIIFDSFAQNHHDQKLFIRASQIGYLPTDLKTAIILSNYSQEDKKYFLINTLNDQIVYSGPLNSLEHSLNDLKFCYEIDFTKFTDTGSFKIEIEGVQSFPFSISEDVFNKVRDSLSFFFKVQRCGPTNPTLHLPCHLQDATSLIGLSDSLRYDLTGGWHDAGDYIKFLTTTAYTSYLLLFSYEFDNEKFNYDLDKNNVPDILEEARIGLDWLLRCNIKDDLLVTQVQNDQDHSVGWRLPENDYLTFNRPAYVGATKKQAGLYVAALSLASRIWKERFLDIEFSEKCLSKAKSIYSVLDNLTDVDTVNSKYYAINSRSENVALGAIELFLSTKDSFYFYQSKKYFDEAEQVIWWSWGDINPLAFYKIAKLDKHFSKYIYRNLVSFKAYSLNNLFNEGLENSWGTTNTFLGISFQSILYKDLTGSDEFDDLCFNHRDYVLGRNAWGISFITKIGSDYPKELHSQVAFFNKGNFPGALVGGPAPKTTLRNYKFYNKAEHLGIKNFNEFNTESSAYFDYLENFITNEATISSNATALFVFGYFSSAK